jgi:hypothetical protein
MQTLGSPETRRVRAMCSLMPRDLQGFEPTQA